MPRRRAARLAVLSAVLSAVLGAAGALSTCRSLDLEAARRKRIEAVTAEDEWLWFDVTDTVQQWLSDTEPLGVFKLSVHCPCDEGPEDMRVTIEGFERQRGDLQGLSRRRRRVPHVLAMALCRARARQPAAQRPAAPPRSTPTSASGPTSTAAACAPCTSTSGGTCSGSGSTSRAGTWPTCAWGPAPSSGARTPSTARFWRCTRSTTRGGRPPRAASPRRS
ncbi:hypothetical protein Q9233_017738, partial [Columba guinea]